MTDDLKKLKKEGSRAKKVAAKEESWLLREYHDSKELEQDLEKNKPEAAAKILRYVQRDERRLEREHVRLKHQLSDWKGDLRDESVKALRAGKEKIDSFIHQMTQIETQVHVFENDLMKNFSRYVGEIGSATFKDHPDTVIELVKKLIKEMQAWVALDERMKKLIEEMNHFLQDYEPESELVKNYQTVNAAPQEKLHDLLKGAGYYQKFSQGQRRDLWNRWVRSTTQRVLKNLNAPGAELQGFDFSSFIFQGTVHLENANLSRTNLFQAQLLGTHFGGASLSGANLSGANLFGIILNGADLKKANLSGADLRGAGLSGADFTGANLGGADLRRAYLSRADLSHARLTRAYLGGTDLEEANLRGADLEDVKNLTKEQLHSTRNWKYAKNIPKYVLKIFA